MRSSASRVYPSVSAAVLEVRGWQFEGYWRRLAVADQGIQSVIGVYRAALHQCQRGLALKSNYTTITSSLIKLRATRLIQPCDPAERAHGSLHCSDIIQSVLQRRTANWWCCYVCSSVSQLWSGLWLQSRVTPSNYSLMFPTVHYLICVSQKSTFERFFVSNSESFGSQRWSDRQKFHFKMNNLAFEMWHLLLHTK